MTHPLCWLGYHKPLRVLDDVEMLGSDLRGLEFKVLAEHVECLRCAKRLGL